jgi:hypothetical protein
MYRSHPTLGLLVLAVLGFCRVPMTQGHPVPRRIHDRTISVHLGKDGVLVNYRLEVDEFTAVYDDLPALGDQLDLTRLTTAQECRDAFIRCYAPILADNLLGTLNGKPLEFKCAGSSHTIRDEDGQMLDHLRCDFQFKATWQLAPGKRHAFSFKEGNYELEAGRVRLALTSTAPLTLLSKTQPDAALQTRPYADLQPGDEARLRTATATFTLPASNTPEPETKPPPVPSSGDPAPDRSTGQVSPSAETAAETPATSPSGVMTALSAAAVVCALAGGMFLCRRLRLFARG